LLSYSLKLKIKINVIMLYLFLICVLVIAIVTFVVLYKLFFKSNFSKTTSISFIKNGYITNGKQVYASGAGVLSLENKETIPSQVADILSKNKITEPYNYISVWTDGGFRAYNIAENTPVETSIDTNISTYLLSESKEVSVNASKSISFIKNGYIISGKQVYASGAGVLSLENKDTIPSQIADILSKNNIREAYNYISVWTDGGFRAYNVLENTLVETSPDKNISTYLLSEPKQPPKSISFIKNGYITNVKEVYASGPGVLSLENKETIQSQVADILSKNIITKPYNYISVWTDGGFRVYNVPENIPVETSTDTNISTYLLGEPKQATPPPVQAPEGLSEPLNGVNLAGPAPIKDTIPTKYVYPLPYPIPDYKAHDANSWSNIFGSMLRNPETSIDFYLRGSTPEELLGINYALMSAYNNSRYQRMTNSIYAVNKTPFREIPLSKNLTMSDIYYYMAIRLLELCNLLTQTERDMLLQLAYNMGNIPGEPRLSVDNWTNVRPDRIQTIKAWSDPGKEFNFIDPDGGMSKINDDYLTFAEWGKVIQEEPTRIKNSVVIAKYIMGNFDGSLKQEQIKLLSETFNIPIPTNREADPTINWDNANKTTENTLKSYLLTVRNDNMLESMIGPYKGQYTLVNWAYAMWNNPKRFRDRMLRNVIDNFDNTLTQKQVNAMAKRFDGYY